MQKYLKFKLVVFLAVISVLTSCTSGLGPLPGEVGPLNLSLSIPVAVSEVGLNKTYSIGPPNWFLTQDVPSWAKYEYIYYSDTVTVDLHKIYEKSEDVSYLAFSINIWNEFPAPGTIELSFIDPSDAVLYTFPTVTIRESAVLFNGNIVSPGYSNSKIEFDKSSIEGIRTADRLVYYLKIKLKDVNTGYFPYFDGFKMKCHLGARVDFILNEV